MLFMNYLREAFTTLTSTKQLSPSADRNHAQTSWETSLTPLSSVPPTHDNTAAAASNHWQDTACIVAGVTGIQKSMEVNASAVNACSSTVPTVFQHAAHLQPAHRLQDFSSPLTAAGFTSAVGFLESRRYLSILQAALHAGQHKQQIMS